METRIKLDKGMVAWIRGCITLIIASLLLAGTTTSFSDHRNIEESFDTYLRPYVESRNFSGTVLVAKGDRIVFNKGFGMADYEKLVPNTGETSFRIASLSKTFTAAAILLLENQGQLSLGDSVDGLLGDIAGGSEITVHQLLTHTSGLPRIVFFSDYGERSKWPHTTGELVEWINDKPLAFEPGERYGYSNANYVLLARIIEQVSGVTYGEFLSANIFEPLGLDASGYRTNTEVEDLARGNVPEGLREIAPARQYDYSIVTGAGSLYSSAKDLLTWFRAQQRNPLLASIMQKKMFDESNAALEYGWNIGHRLDRDAIYKTGWDGVGFGAQLVHYPENDLTVIVLTNFNVSSITAEIADNIAAIVFGATYEPLHLIEKPNVAADVLNDMAGLYRFGSDFYVPDSTIRIAERNGQLVIPGDSVSPLGALLPVSGLDFIHRQHWFKVRFNQDADGRIVGMQYGGFEVTKDSGN